MKRVMISTARRVACLSTRIFEAAPGRSTSYLRQDSRCFFTSVRELHSTRPIAEPGRTESTFVDRKNATDRILAVVQGFEKVDPTKVTASASFKDDLALDSLDAVEVVMAIEDEFNIEIPDSEADKIGTVADAIEYVITHPAASQVKL